MIWIFIVYACQLEFKQALLYKQDCVNTTY